MGIGCSKAIFSGIALVLVLTGCRSGSTDTNTVIAKIGNEKVTETQFHDLIKALAGDPESANEFLTEEKNRGQRNEFLTKYIEGKGLIMMAKDEGLDKDIKIRLQVDDAIINIYAQALIERRMPTEEPTEEQLLEVYNEIAAQQKAMGNGMPPFKEAKPHLPPLWKQKQQQGIAESLMKEIKEKYPPIVADEYKTAIG